MEGLGTMDFKHLTENPRNLLLTWRLATTLYVDSLLLLMLHVFMLSYLNDLNALRLTVFCLCSGAYIP